jgi:hypothetical protein
MVIILDLFHQASVQISLIVKAGHQKQTVLKRFYRKIGTTNMKGANGNGIGNVINNPNTVRQGLALPLLNALHRRMNTVNEILSLGNKKNTIS